MKKTFFLIVAAAIILVISLGIYSFVFIYPKWGAIPDGKGFIPLQFNFENDIRNITLTPDASASVKMITHLESR